VLFLLLLVLFFQSNPASLDPIEIDEVKPAQFGVIWNYPEDEISARRELITFQKVGYSAILLKQLPSLNLLELLNQFDFDVSVMLPVVNLTVSRLQESKASLEAQLYDYSFYLKDYTCIKDVGLFNNGQVYSEEFSRNFEQFYTLQKETFPFRIFYVHKETSENILSDSIPWFVLTRGEKKLPIFKENRVKAILFSEKDSVISNRQLQNLVIQANGKIIYLPSDLVLNGSFRAKQEREIVNYIKFTGHLIPIEYKAEIPNKPDYLVMLFWLCVLVFGLHFSIDPNFRKSISRYFFAHGFFATDIMENRVRFRMSSLIAAITQSVLSGTLIILLFNYILTEESILVINDYFPYMKLWTYNLVGLFLFGFLHHFLLIIIQVIWVYAGFSEFKNIMQPATLVLWPQVLNFFIAVIIVNAYFNNLSGKWIGVFYLIYLFVIIISFLLACNDVFSAGKKVIPFDHLKTTIPYITIVILFLMVYLVLSGFYDATGLAFHVSH
jgi:hypothetical protein